MRLLAICLLAFLTGCAVTRNVNISATPAGAAIDIDGVRQPRNPGTYSITWEGEGDSHNVTAELAGYQARTIQLKRDDPRTDVKIELKPLTRAFTINVEPVPATIKINDVPVRPELLTSYTTPRELDVSRDPASGAWKKYTITAEREGYKSATDTMSYPDNKNVYTLKLSPVEKDFSVNTIPPGASVEFDGQSVGVSPIEKITREFPYDVTTNQYYPHKLRATLPGYPPQERDVSYDEGKASYEIRFEPLKKTFRIRTTPPGGIVSLEGQQYKTDANGDTSITLPFPPATSGKADYKTYTGEIVKPKTANAEWYPLPITIGWDEGKSDYSFNLREIRTMKMPLLTVEIERGENRWTVVPKTRETIAGKHIEERFGQTLTQLTPSEAKGKNIDGLAVSPDGKWLVYTVLVEKPELHSLMFRMPTDGSSAPVLLNDGNSLDLTPSFSPDGELVLYSSDRAADRLILCGMSSSGGRRIEQYTLGQTTDWWPSMDSSNKTRIFYEARSDRLAKPGLYSRMIDTNTQVDLGVEGGMKPRINAQNDTVLYECYNEKATSQKRDIWRISDGGTGRVNLTNTPEYDDYDANWDRVGARMAYVSDQGVDEDKNHNADIWVLDLTQDKAQPQRVTSNPSHDDHPVWDPSGKAIYFRSNRGGEWGIWKIGLQ